jgi:glutamate synthase (NADPH) large chain
LRAVIEQHVAYTDSAVGAALLADWPASVGRFSAIVARDFRRVLEATRRAAATGEDVDAAVMAAARS